MFEKIPHNTNRCDNGEKDGLLYAGDTWYDHNDSGYALSKADAKINAKLHGRSYLLKGLSDEAVGEGEG